MRKINKPRLRFKEFKGEWKNKSFSQIFDYVTDYVANGSFEDIRKNVRKFNTDNYAYLIRLQDYSNDWKGPWTYTDKNGYDYLKKSRLNPGDIVMSNVGNSLSTTFKVPELDKPMTLAPNTILMKSSKNNNSFLFQLIISKKIKNKIWNMSSTSAQPKINKTDFKKINVIIPEMEKEQRQIGLFFDKIDNLIDLKSNKISSLERLKRGYLQKLFTDPYENKSKLRFKGFNDDWNVEQLKNIGQFKSGYGFPDKEQGGKSGIPFFKVSDMANNKSEMKKSNNYVNEKQIIDNSWKVINPVNSAIIFAKVGAALNKNRKRIVSKPFLIDNNIMAYSFDDSWSSLFGFSLFLTLFLPKYAQVGALPSFNAGDIGSITVRIPTIEEQSKIGTIMKLIDKHIDIQQKELEHLKSLKKGYLQKMFI